MTIMQAYLVETNSPDRALAGESAVYGEPGNLFWRRYPGPEHTRVHLGFDTIEARSEFDSGALFDWAKTKVHALSRGKQVKVAELPTVRSTTPFAVLIS